MENDDLDVTKGAKITVTLSESMKGLTLNPLPHQPYKYENLYIFARGWGRYSYKRWFKASKKFSSNL